MIPLEPGDLCKLALASALLAACAIAAADDASPTSVRSVTLDGARRIDAELGGMLEDYATPRIEGGGRALIVLVRAVAARGSDIENEQDDARSVDPCIDGEEASAPRSLWRLHVEQDGSAARWELLSDDLPDGATALLSGDVDADGLDELLVAGPAEILLFQETERGPGTAGPFAVLDSRELGERATDVRFLPRTLDETSGLLPIADVGRTRFLRPAHPETANRRWTRVAEIETPVEHRLSDGRLSIYSPAVQRVGRDAAGREIFVSRPNAVGRQRLRLLRITPEADEATRVECWARLPTPENLREWYVRMLDDRPVLIVTTMPADRLSLFGEKRLRVFALEQDRSRLGHLPLFAVETRINQWQSTEVFLFDVDGNGLDDLVLGYWKGLKNSRVVLDVYTRSAAGISSTPRTTAFDVREGDRSYLEFGSDVDGDDRPDLLLVAGKRLQLHRGLGTATGRKLVSPKPEWAVRMQEGDAPERVFGMTIGSSGLWSVTEPDPNRPPRAADLDGDGVAEIVFSRSGEDGKQRLVVIVVDRP